MCERNKPFKMSNDEIYVWLTHSVRLKYLEHNDICFNGMPEQTLPVVWHMSAYQDKSQTQLVNKILSLANGKTPWICQFIDIDTIYKMRHIRDIKKVGVSLNGVYKRYPIIDIYDKLCSFAPTEKDFNESVEFVKVFSEYWESCENTYKQKNRFKFVKDNTRYQHALKALEKFDTYDFNLMNNVLSSLSFAYENDILIKKDNFYLALPWISNYSRLRCVLDNEHLNEVKLWFARSATKTHGGYNFKDGYHKFWNRVCGKTINIFYDEMRVPFSYAKSKSEMSNAIKLAISRLKVEVWPKRVALNQIVN